MNLFCHISFVERSILDRDNQRAADYSIGLKPLDGFNEQYVVVPYSGMHIIVPIARLQQSLFICR